MAKDKVRFIFVTIIPDKQVLYIIQIEGHPAVTGMRDNHKTDLLVQKIPRTWQPKPKHMTS